MLWESLKLMGISRREADVVELVSRGLRNKDVAHRLYVTEKTVKFHLTNVYRKLKIKSRSQLIVWCMPHLSFDDEAKKELPEIDPAWTLAAGRTKVGNA